MPLVKSTPQATSLTDIDEPEPDGTVQSTLHSCIHRRSTQVSSVGANLASHEKTALDTQGSHRCLS